MTYHHRRVLGTLVHAGNEWMQLDEFDRKYAQLLVERGMASSFDDRLFMSTITGQKAWSEWMTPRHLRNSQGVEAVAMNSELNLDHDDARAIQCPKCHTVHPSECMRYRTTEMQGRFRVLVESGWRCPNCAFSMTSGEADDRRFVVFRFPHV